MTQLRIGSVPYLNADPLVDPLRDRHRFPDVDLSFQVPSLLLESLLRGQLDAALVSTAGVLPEPDLRIIPAGCVAARGAVRSIQIYSKVPLSEVRTLALDSSSRSASALTRLIFRMRFDQDPVYHTLAPDLGAMLSECDAALLIGNPCLTANQTLDSGCWTGPAVQRTDLGSAWMDLTGLPFVYAVWAAPSTADLDRLTVRLSEAARQGTARLEELAQAGARDLRIPADEALLYLLDTIRYALGPEERAGMERFCQLGREHGVLPATAEVRYALAGCEAGA